MSAAYNDGAVPYGSRILSIINTTTGATAVVFVAENVSIQRPTNIIERKDENDEPSGQVLVKNFNTGSATLQLATSTTVPPDEGATFSITLDSVRGSETFVVSEVGQVESQGEAKKVNISFRKKYGA
jgi:hypothetical protein